MPGFKELLLRIESPQGHSRTCRGQYYLVKASEGHTAHHDRGIQANPSEEAGTLQGHICSSRLRLTD